MTNGEAIEILEERWRYSKTYKYTDAEIREAFDMAIKALEQEPCEDKGEISDGYHTFNQLYHQRAILFATIVNQNKDKAWKSYKHSDGKYCFDSNGEWFIVGVDTSEGSYTYHYSKEYWDYFDCKELDCGKEWDGHTEEDVTRLLSLEQEPCEDCISRQAAIRIAEQGQVQGYMWQFKELVKLPSATPQPKTGHWMDRFPAKECKCSVCDFLICISNGSYIDMVGQMKYCPNCGAKMVEPQESEG